MKKILAIVLVILCNSATADNELMHTLADSKNTATANGLTKSQRTATGQTIVDEAKAAFDKGDYNKALLEARPSAEQGNVVDQNILGRMYLEGKGVAQNYEQALYWFRKAADRGYVNSQHNLGIMYQKGLGVAQNNAQSIEWYRKSAEQGFVPSQIILGSIYQNGLGAPDPTSYFVTTSDYLARIPIDYSKAAKWYRMAAEQGNAEGQNELAFMYANGQGFPKDYSKAAEWYRKSAEQGNAEGQANLGFMYANGQGIPQDYSKAAEWNHKAAEQGNAVAEINLGVAYANGQGVPQSYTNALDWYQKAAKQGNKDAESHAQALENQLAANNQIKEDEARGYRHISIADYQLDADSMRIGRKLIVSGFYEVEGDVQTLSKYPSFAIPNQYHIYLLTDNAPRYARKKLIDFQQPIQCGSSRPCRLTFLGHIEKCTYSVLGRKVRDTVCLDVDDIRNP
jgi:TPR repeat protein